MENEYMKRGYLLPTGCKDLIDVLNLQARQDAQPAHAENQSLPPLVFKSPLPPLLSEVVLEEQMSVRNLATALKQKPYRILADLMEFGVFAGMSQLISFEIIAKVARKYGYKAVKAS